MSRLAVSFVRSKYSVGVFKSENFVRKIYGVSRTAYLSSVIIRIQVLVKNFLGVLRIFYLEEKFPNRIPVIYVAFSTIITFALCFMLSHIYIYTYT